MCRERYSPVRGAVPRTGPSRGACRPAQGKRGQVLRLAVRTTLCGEEKTRAKPFQSPTTWRASDTRSPVLLMNDVTGQNHGDGVFERCRRESVSRLSPLGVRDAQRCHLLWGGLKYPNGHGATRGGCQSAEGSDGCQPDRRWDARANGSQHGPHSSLQSMEPCWGYHSASPRYQSGVASTLPDPRGEGLARAYQDLWLVHRAVYLDA